MQTLHAQSYTDPEIFTQESNSIFLREWIPIAHSSEFQQDTFAIERRFLHHSIILIRDHKQFRALHNVCPHRAGPLLWEGESTSRNALRCRYHGWRFDLSGQCTHQPDFGENVKAQLAAIHVRIWDGLIFCCFATEPPEFHWSSLLETHAPRLRDYTFYKSATHHIACNWKTYVENYLEGYHIPYLHPSLRSSIRLSDYKIRCHDTLITHEVSTKVNAQVSGFWAYLWPITALNMYGSSMSIERINPIDTHNIEIHYLYLSVPGTSAPEMEHAIAMSKQVTQEDIQICNTVAKNLRSGIYTQGQLSPKHEQGIQHMYTLRKKAQI